jgi:hypothetical protein
MNDDKYDQRYNKRIYDEYDKHIGEPQFHEFMIKLIRFIEQLKQITRDNTRFYVKLGLSHWMASDDEDMNYQHNR